MIDQKQLEKVEYFNYLDSIIPNDARCTRDIKYRIAMAKTSNQQEDSSVAILT
jgi:hypothetical protein